MKRPTSMSAAEYVRKVTPKYARKPPVSPVAAKRKPRQGKATLLRRYRAGGQSGPVSCGPRWVEVEVPVRVVSALNLREHHWQKAKRVKNEREVTTLMLTHREDIRETIKAMEPPYVVTMTRLGPTAIADSDNLQSGLKSVRDSIAAVLGLDDRDSRITWTIAPQEKADHYAAKIRIEGRES